jgi:hypothetical protein
MTTGAAATSRFVNEFTAAATRSNTTPTKNTRRPSRSLPRRAPRTQRARPAHSKISVRQSIRSRTRNGLHGKSSDPRTRSQRRLSPSCERRERRSAPAKRRRRRGARKLLLRVRASRARSPRPPRKVGLGSYARRRREGYPRFNLTCNLGVRRVSMEFPAPVWNERAPASSRVSSNICLS